MLFSGLALLWQPAPAYATVTAHAVTYGSWAGETGTLYDPGASKPKPTIVYVHGGGWSRSTINSDESTFARNLSTSTGWPVLAINYPVTAIGAEPERQVEPDAVNHAVQYAATLSQADPAHLILWGESAGGQLALLDAYRDAVATHPRVSAVVSVSGPADMLTTYQFMAAYFPLDPNNHNLVSDFLGATPSEAALVGSTVYINTSPDQQVTSNTPPTYQAIGSADPLVPPAADTALDSALFSHGVTSQLDVLSTADHAYLLEPDVVAGTSQTVTQRAVGFLLTHYATRS